MACQNGPLRRLLMVGTVLVLAVVAGAVPASAGGSWFTPVEDRYEPGEEATMVGYTGGGAYGWVDDGPFFGFLVDSNDNGEMVVDGPRRPLGEIELEDTGEGGYLRLRASITFTIPADIEPGMYWLDYCNADCSERLGDLIGGIIHVGVDPEFAVSREWSLDDPEVANLDDGARLSGPGFDVAAADVRDDSADDLVIGVSDQPGQSTTTAIFAETAPASATGGLDPSVDADLAAFNEPGESILWGYGVLAAALAVGAGAVVGRRSRTRQATGDTSA
jgi:hypothetical protein